MWSNKQSIAEYLVVKETRVLYNRMLWDDLLLKPHKRLLAGPQTPRFDFGSRMDWISEFKSEIRSIRNPKSKKVSRWP
jgi:hypothetical protein